MPRPLSEAKPEDIDAQFTTIKKVADENGTTIIGAIVGVTSGSIATKLINDFSGGQPVEAQGRIKFGLKFISTLIGVGELAGTLGMNSGGVKKFAVAGGASHIAVHAVDMVSDFTATKGVVFPKKPNNPKPGVQQWQPKQQRQPQQRQQQPPEPDGPPELRGA